MDFAICIVWIWIYWSFAYIYLWINLFYFCFINSIGRIFFNKQKNQTTVIIRPNNNGFSSKKKYSKNIIYLQHTTCNVFTINPSLMSSKTWTKYKFFVSVYFSTSTTFKDYGDGKWYKNIYSTSSNWILFNTKLCGRLIGQFECDMHVHWSAKYKWRERIKN